jgi:hypothetical protein
MAHIEAIRLNGEESPLEVLNAKLARSETVCFRSFGQPSIVKEALITE